MNRLTEKHEDGNWCLKGLSWEKISPNKQISFDQKEYEALYGALCKLKDYEDTDLSPDEVERVNSFKKSQVAHLLLTLNQERKKNQWIPADEPPKTDDYILLSFENFTPPLVGRYEPDGEGGGKFYVGDDMESCISADLYVNAWMPLPEPYGSED